MQRADRYLLSMVQTNAMLGCNRGDASHPRLKIQLADKPLHSGMQFAYNKLTATAGL